MGWKWVMKRYAQALRWIQTIEQSPFSNERKVGPSIEALMENRSIRYRPRDKIRFDNRRSKDRPFNIKLYRLKFFGSINSNNNNLKVCSLGCWFKILKFPLTYCMGDHVYSIDQINYLGSSETSFSSFMLKAMNEVLWWSRCWRNLSTMDGSCIP